MKRPKMDNLVFKQICQEEADTLIIKFTEDEIRKTVWHCDSDTSSDPNGVSCWLHIIVLVKFE
jgi:hypothetical protein